MWVHPRINSQEHRNIRNRVFKKVWKNINLFSTSQLFTLYLENPVPDVPVFLKRFFLDGIFLKLFRLSTHADARSGCLDLFSFSHKQKWKF